MGIPRQTDGQQGAKKEAGDACGDAHGSPDGNNKIGGGGGILTLPQQGDADISQLTRAARRNYQNRVGNINQISKGTMMSFISIL